MKKLKDIHRVIFWIKGDWGLGIGDWVLLGIEDGDLIRAPYSGKLGALYWVLGFSRVSPIPNPQSHKRPFLS